ncbi:MAG: hypothetical protein KatS3mg105_4623 [Gemmatales bacterium]|nr:MAG: hypothetical protein KatS3mg105_4623 [Gemmatales bacterium]
MKPCKLFQQDMFEFVYGLLEGEDHREIEQHVAECAECQEALRQAQEQREQLARAAKLSFPEIRFEAPAAETLLMPSGLPEKQGMLSRGWLRWSVAAGILIMIGGLTLPAGLYSQQRDRMYQAKAKIDDITKQRVARAEEANAADRELQAILNEIRKLRQEQEQETQKAIDEALKKTGSDHLDRPQEAGTGSRKPLPLETAKAEWPASSRTHQRRVARSPGEFDRGIEKRANEQERRTRILLAEGLAAATGRKAGNGFASGDGQG